MGRVILLGIDGLDYRLIQEFIDELPAFKKISTNGFGSKMKSVFPPDTTPAWATIFTGLDPSEHGVINFVNIKDKNGNYKPLELNDSMLRGKTFWDIASLHGKKVSIVLPKNVYPGWDVNGCLVTRSNRNPNIKTPLSVHPDDALDSITHNVQYLNDRSGYISRNKLNDFIRAAKDETFEEFNIGIEVFKKYNPDLFFLYISQIDGIQHILWNYYDKTHPNYPGTNKYESVIKDFYKYADEIVQKFIDELNADDTLFVFSDHGHGLRPYIHVNINEIFRQEGLLTTSKKSDKKSSGNKIKSAIKRVGTAYVRRFGVKGFLLKFMHFFPIWKKILASSNDFDWEHTKAYVSDLSTVKSYSYGGIRICNYKDKEEYEQLRDKVIHLLKPLKHPDSGIRLVNWICKREDIYNGEYIDKYPDILLELVEGYGLGWQVNEGLIGEGSIYKIQPGSHSRDYSILFVHGMPKDKIIPENVDINGIAASVLATLNIKAGENMKGSFIES